jgi:Heterokaryon incompatibility protein (HET)
MSTYIYEPLLHEDSIRLLILEPAKMGERICCRIEQSRLSLNPKYNAISYVWGESLNKYVISIDGYTFEVRRNLYNALQCFRNECVPRTLWVDAICLNQNDIVERNHQVKLMRRIYAKTELTLIWYGEATEEDMPGLELISRYETTIPNHFSWSKFPSSPISKRALVDTLQTGHNFLEQLNSVKAIMEKPWT